MKARPSLQQKGSATETGNIHLIQNGNDSWFASKMREYGRSERCVGYVKKMARVYIPYILHTSGNRCSYEVQKRTSLTSSGDAQA